MNFKPALKPKLKTPKNNFDLPPPKFNINTKSPGAKDLPPPRFTVSKPETSLAETFVMSDPPMKTTVKSET